MRYTAICADPPWLFNDRLKMGKTRRSAVSQYKTLTHLDIETLPVWQLAEENCMLVLWVPSSMVENGMRAMGNWGFKQKQVFNWTKTKVDPWRDLKVRLKALGQLSRADEKPLDLKEVLAVVDSFDPNEILTTNMGWGFRSTKEIALVGWRGSIRKIVKVRDQLDNLIAPQPWGEHSEKPEGLQDKLDLMFPDAKKLEMFARRDRPGWTCVGLECPSTLGEDIRDSIKRLVGA